MTHCLLLRQQLNMLYKADFHSPEATPKTYTCIYLFVELRITNGEHKYCEAGGSKLALETAVLQII